MNAETIRDIIRKRREPSPALSPYVKNLCFGRLFAGPPFPVYYSCVMRR